MDQESRVAEAWFSVRNQSGLGIWHPQDPPGSTGLLLNDFQAGSPASGDVSSRWGDRVRASVSLRIGFWLRQKVVWQNTAVVVRP